MAIELPITNGFYMHPILPISHQRCSNVYPSIPTVPALSKEQLLFTPGLNQLASSGDIEQANRGAHAKNDIPYFVNGDALYRLNRTVVSEGGVTSIEYTVTSLGTIEGTGLVSMADNGTQLMVLVPGGKGYIYNENVGVPFQEITDTDFTANGNPQIVVFVDGYFLITTDSKKFIISALNDGLTYDALDSATAESDPDTIVAPIILNNITYITGSETTEGFQNSPSAGQMPFVRNNIILDKGCKAPFSLVKSNSAFYMVGAGVNESPAIWKFIGNGFIKVSTEVIDQLLTTYSEAQINGISAFSYASSGSYFIVFNLPDTAICFDVITQRWHERNSLIDETEEPWRARSLITAYGLVLAGDSVDGRIGRLSLENLKDYDETMIRLFSTQPFVDEGDEIIAKMLELTVKSGVGNDEVPNPVVSLATSSNGITFNPERTRVIGKKGEYDRRVVWYRNGRYDRFVVFQVRLSEPVGTAFIKLEYE